MKQLTLLAALIVMPVAQVCAASWSIGGGIGIASGDADATALNNQLTAEGVNATASNTKANRTGKQLFVGYQYTKDLGVTLGYVDLGQVNTIISGSVSDINAFLSSVSEIHPSTAQGWQLSANYKHKIEPTISLVARAGVFDWQTKYTLQTTGASFTVNDSGVSGTLGFGIEQEIKKDTRLSFNYDSYKIDGEIISIIGMRMSVNFGL